MNNKSYSTSYALTLDLPNHHSQWGRWAHRSDGELSRHNTCQKNCHAAKCCDGRPGRESPSFSDDHSASCDAPASVPALPAFPLLIKVSGIPLIHLNPLAGVKELVQHLI